MDYAHAQEDELVVLESIYADQITRLPCTDGHALAIRLDVNLASSQRFICWSDDAPSIALTTTTLPPLLITLHLPPTYPGKSFPRIEAVHTWLPEEGKEEPCYLPPGTQRMINNKLLELWKENGGVESGEEGEGEGEGVLWSWLDWLGTGLFLDDDNDNATSEITKDAQGAYIIPCRNPTLLHTLLRAHLTASATAEFHATLFPCGICFDTKKGRSCVSLPCERACVFCKECLEACWGLAIREGSVEGVACPGWECVKGRAKRDAPVASEGEQKEEEDDGREMAIELVRQVVGAELAERYLWLKEKKKVENDPTYTICPLQHCQAPVPPPPLPSSRSPTRPTKSARIFRLGQPSSSPEKDAAVQEEREHAAEKRRQQADEDMADRFRQCPACQFSFCRFCNKTWHGNAPCPLPSTASFLQKYMATAEGSPERAGYEKRYGKKQLTRMVAEWVEQQANSDWFDKFTRACPGCQTRVNKSAGCNHMTCSKCLAHFCYRCGTKLRPSDPYHHYRTPGSSCFEKLFDADEIARFEREIAEPGAGAPEGFEDDEAFAMNLMAVDGWVDNVFPLQGNGGWW